MRDFLRLLVEIVKGIFYIPVLIVIFLMIMVFCTIETIKEKIGNI